MLRLYASLLLTVFVTSALNAQDKKPLRVAVAGLIHTHVHWILNRAHDGDFEIVGISEPNRALALRYLKQYNLSEDLLYTDLGTMLDKTKPEAVTAFGSTFAHLEVVRTCAPRKIHVMVEKPLAVNLEHAKEMYDLAKKHDISLLTNYETTWYGTNQRVQELLGKIGSVRKIVVHDGHEGPAEIGVNVEFLEWLTDPVLNGGGALMDFGCYGANLATWMLNGEKPISVSCVTQQIKPDIYPKVDDEATIIVTYPKTQAIFQASWNWPFGRKDMEVYGVSGYFLSDRNAVWSKTSPDMPEKSELVGPLATPLHDPFAYLRAVVRKEITVKPSDLSSLENNMIVMEILDAATRSAKTGMVVRLR